MAQTAVEWLKDKLKETYDKEGKLPLAYTLHLTEQAKKMEKEQIMNSWEDGKDSFSTRNAEQYYNETYCEYSGLPSVKFYEEKREGGR